MIRPVIAGLSIVLLAGCGASPFATDAAPVGAVTQQAPAGAPLPSMTAAAEKLGCTGYALDAENHEIFVGGAATCKGFGDEVSIDIFSTNQARDQWMKAAAIFGARAVLLDRMAISGRRAATADAIQARLGGAIRP